jgi:hypothetical protein
MNSSENERRRFRKQSHLVHSEVGLVDFSMDTRYPCYTHNKGIRTLEVDQTDIDRAAALVAVDFGAET